MSKFTQKRGNRTYVVDVEKCLVTSLEPPTFDRASQAFKDTFLPLGYPHSVKPEYAMFQVYDSLQGLASYLRSVLTSKALLIGAGVGNAEASALAVALTWIVRDGLGMISSLVFAYSLSGLFEAYPREFRFLADVLCNVGLLSQMLVLPFPGLHFPLGAMSSICGACVGIAAGACKARISAFLAMPGHLADVTAKESTQETAVTLVGMVLGYVLTAYCIPEDDHFITWGIFILCTLMHVYCNVCVACSVVFNTLNAQRCYLLFTWPTDRPTQHFGLDCPPRKWPDPTQVARRETLFSIPYVLFHFHIA